MKEMYIFSIDFLLILNLILRKRFSRVRDIFVYILIRYKCLRV